MHKKSRGLSAVMPTCHMVSCNFSVVVGSSTYMPSSKSFGPFPTMSEKIEATIFDYLYFLDVPIVFPFVSELQRSERIGQDTNKVVPVFCRDTVTLRAFKHGCKSYNRFLATSPNVARTNGIISMSYQLIRSLQQKLEDYILLLIPLTPI